jgi:WD40 repeat protein
MKDDSSIFAAGPEKLNRLFSLALGELQAPEPPAASPDATAGQATVSVDAASERPGGRIGRYKLLRVLGEGGMGIVYLAEQEEPVKRQVALKVIKPGMDSQRVIARFEAEQQALALMDHPHVAQVYDAGLTLNGRPYFVMEYVKGIPVTEHCDKYKLTIEERLRLFLHVCEAIRHAHQKGIIHRDLKPSNILVTVEGNEAIPKVIDFGVARAISQPLTVRTLFTEQGQLVGTPEYISPEQVEMSNQDIDTRADIYSLGAVLYELIAGVLPFDPQALREGGFDHIRKVICEEEPKTPSTRLSKTPMQESAQSARCRGTSAKALQRRLHGDLDWIVMKAMEKDRTRRYGTAEALADDIERHLNNEPVLAGPPGALYRFQKLVRRNREVFGAVGAVAVVLILGVVVSTWQAILARRAERTATEKSIIAETERQRAHRNLYAADMVQAQQALDQANLRRVNELLDKYRAANSNLSTPNAQRSPDLRGWEWRYLWSHSGSDELYTLGWHRSFVELVVFSEDGSLLATASDDKSVKLWDLARRREVAAINFPSMPADLCFVPKSRTVAAATGKEVCFLDGPTGQKMGVIPCEDYVWSVAYSRDGSRLAIYQGTTLRMLDTLTQREMWRTAVPAGWRVAFSPGGSLLAVASNERAVLLLDAVNGQLAASLPGFGKGYGGSLVFSPDGALLACACAFYHQVLVHEVRTRQQLRGIELEPSWLGAVAFSPDGKTVAISGGSHVITLFDRETWQVSGRLQGHLDEVWAVAFSPDGKTLVSGSKDASVRVWDAVVMPQRDPELPLPGEKDAFVLSSDGSKLCVLTTNNTFAVWDTPTFRPLAQGSLPDANVIHSATSGFTKPLAISSDGRRLFSLTPTGQVRVWDTETREFPAVLETGVPDLRALALSPDEKKLAVAARDGVVRLWDLQTKMRTDLPPTPSWPSSLVFSPDNQLLAIGCAGGEVEAWQISGLRKLLSRPFHTNLISALAISSDPQFLAVASQDERVTLWDLQKGTLIGVFSGTLNSYNSVAISRDGQRVFAGGEPSVLSVWDTGSLQSVGTFTELRGFPTGGLAILSGSDTVVSVGGVLRLWRAPSFAEIEAASKRQKSEQPSLVSPFL